MSKSTLAREFRKVDVDKFDEDRFQDDQGDEDQVHGPNESEVSQLLMSKKNADALILLLQNPPTGSKSKELKDKAFQLMIRVLTAFKSSEVEAAVKKLSKNDLDVLMKYLYRGFEEPTENSCGILLTWHEKVVAVAGLGSIIRVLTDRKTV